MSGWTVSEKAVEALRHTADGLSRTLEQLEQAQSALTTALEEQENGLGAHSDSIRALLEETARCQAQASVPAKKLCVKLLRAAMVRQRHREENPYGSAGQPGPGSAPAGAGTQKGGPTPEERTIFELSALEKQLELTDGDPNVRQLAGLHGELKQQLAGSGYHSHHIPARSVLDMDADALPALAIQGPDHAGTSSYGGRINRTYEPLLPDSAPPRHKDAVQEQLEQGFLAEIVRDEILELRRDHGTKYDGGIKQYLAVLIAYIRRNGLPRVKRP